VQYFVTLIWAPFSALKLCYFHRLVSVQTVGDTNLQVQVVIILHSDEDADLDIVD
jgi:hypothetical protein